METHKRSLIKGVTWRLVASITTMTIVFLATGDLVLVASVGFFDVVLKVLFYYIHERAWGKVHWGMVGVEPSIKL